ncbi:hypothetical protein HER32_06700 [Hymenobacter sp. BT18]|uniref:hypothetical protein n=1 Tax=Hymenobacter sp. BT18 TaxID=2835648 RepID=UPI00143E50EC|nr:hypothetical protein [Hymenobacter sp. BT18]QIX60882.1 hypothetical protein HER32_06700 [Hymenobacter sp. BT18]
MDLFDLKGPNGADNTPGLLGYVLIAAEEDFTTIAKAPKVAGAAGSTAVIVADHVFAAGKGFVKVYITLASNELKAAVVGERDGRGLKINFEGFHPGNKAEALEFANKVKNIGLIMLVPDPDGGYLQVGTEGLPCELSADYSSAKLDSGRRGFTVKGEAYATGLFLYQGDITMKPAV